MNSGAFQLLQLQEEIRQQFKVDGSGGPEHNVESHIRSNKDTLLNSLWKLNVVDIEVTLLHVCQTVSGFFQSARFFFFSFHQVKVFDETDCALVSHCLCG